MIHWSIRPPKAARSDIPVWMIRAHPNRKTRLTIVALEHLVTEVAGGRARHDAEELVLQQREEDLRRARQVRGCRGHDRRPFDGCVDSAQRQPAGAPWLRCRPDEQRNPMHDLDAGRRPRASSRGVGSCVACRRTTVWRRARCDDRADAVDTGAHIRSALSAQSSARGSSTSSACKPYASISADINESSPKPAGPDTLHCQASTLAVLSDAARQLQKMAEALLSARH